MQRDGPTPRSRQSEPSVWANILVYLIPIAFVITLEKLAQETYRLDVSDYVTGGRTYTTLEPAEEA